MKPEAAEHAAVFDESRLKTRLASGERKQFFDCSGKSFFGKFYCQQILIETYYFVG